MKSEHVTLEIASQDDVGQLLFLINQIRSDPTKKGWKVTCDVLVEEPVKVVPFGKKTRSYYYQDRG